MQSDILTQVTIIASGGAAIPVGAATEASQGTERRVSIANAVPNYAGVEIEVSGLVPNGQYSLIGIMYELVDGTAGNETQPSVGEATGFFPGGFQDRYKILAPAVRGADAQFDVPVNGIPVKADATGHLYIKGASPAETDSLFSYRLDLVLHRSA